MTRNIDNVLSILLYYLYYYITILSMCLSKYCVRYYINGNVQIIGHKLTLLVYKIKLMSSDDNIHIRLLAVCSSPFRINSLGSGVAPRAILDCLR